MIVDFEQDPTAPFGTGNFRDDQGRIMYLHDPDTASEFAKTMPGSGLGQQVASESESIAKNQFGGQAPSGGPDQRVAEYRPPEPEYYDPNAPARDVEATINPAPTSPGADLIAKLDQVTAPPPSPPGAPPQGAPGAPPGAPGAAAPPAAAPAAPAAPGAPGAAPAAAPMGPGAALVQNLSDVQGQLSARSQPQTFTPPAELPAGGLPLAKVKGGESITVKEGRPLANALEQVRDEAPYVQRQIDVLRAQGKAKDEALRQQFAYEKAAQAAGYYEGGAAYAQAKKDYADAVTNQRRLTSELRQNDRSMDPDRYMRQQSFGSKLSMVVLAALNGAFGAVIGKKNNDVLDIVNAEIERDIDRQKNEIANRKTSLSNEMQKYIAQGFNAKQAEALARDKLYSAFLQYAQVQAKEAGAQGQGAREAELLIAPIQQQWAQRRGDIMKESEAQVSHAYDRTQEHAVPPPQILSPQDFLAMFNLRKEKVQQANADVVGGALGHDVTAEEASKLKQDAQEFAAKHATNEMTRGNILAVAKAMGLKEEGGRLTGEANPGVRPLGTSGFDAHARQIDRLWSALSEAKVMGMAREPAAKLQEIYGKAIDRPFYDSDITPMLNDLLELIGRNDENLRKGYGEAATLWDRTPTGGGRPNVGAAPPAAAPRAAPAPAARPAAPAPAAARPVVPAGNPQDY